LSPQFQRKGEIVVLNKLALLIAIIGALNWGSIGLFQFDLVAWICGGPATLLARIIYTVVGLAGIWCITLLFKPYAHAD
jgi:uncharacterized membrane protein YuzA (DUF378 family)